MSLFPWDPWDDKKKLIHISDGSHHVFHIHWVRFLRPGSFNSTPFFGKFGFVVPGAPRWQGANNQVQSPLSHVWCIKYIPILGPGVVQIWQLSSRWISLTILSESPNDMFKFSCGLYYLHITQKKTSRNIMDKSIMSRHISHIMSSLFNHFQAGVLRAWLALWPSTALRVDGSPEPHGSLPHGPQRSCRVVGWCDAHGNPQVPEPVPMASACYTGWWYT